MFDNYNIEEEYNKYKQIVDSLIVNRTTIMVLKEALDKQEGTIYTDVHMSTDANGKPLYKNEELRKIAVNEQIQQSNIYKDFQKQKQLSVDLELRFEQSKMLLECLKQEREFKSKVVL